MRNIQHQILQQRIFCARYGYVTSYPIINSCALSSLTAYGLTLSPEVNCPSARALRNPIYRMEGMDCMSLRMRSRRGEAALLPPLPQFFSVFFSYRGPFI